MQFVAIELPGARIALGETGESFEFDGIPGGICPSGELLQVIANKLIYASPESIRLLACSQEHLIIHGQCDVHTYIIRAHICCVNWIPWNVLISLRGFRCRFPFGTGTRIQSLDGEPTTKFTALKANPIVSDTKKLAWHLSAKSKGLVTLNAERSQALIGHVGQQVPSLRNLAAEVDNAFCAIVLGMRDWSPGINGKRGGRKEKA